MHLGRPEGFDVHRTNHGEILSQSTLLVCFLSKCMGLTDYTDILKCKRLPVLLARRSIRQPVRMQALLGKTGKQNFQISRGCGTFSNFFCTFQIVIHITFNTHSCRGHDVQKLFSFSEFVLILSSIGVKFFISCFEKSSFYKVPRPCAYLCIALLTVALGNPPSHIDLPQASPSQTPCGRDCTSDTENLKCLLVHHLGDSSVFWG